MRIRTQQAIGLVFLAGLAFGVAPHLALGGIQDWERKSEIGPPLVGTARMAYDYARRVSVLFGGFSTDGAPHYVGDTWEWNGEAWTLVASDGPSPRATFAMAHDVARGVTVLYGGEDGGLSDFMGDTWEWDGEAWTQKCSLCTPGPRRGAAMVFDSLRQVAVLFGGQTAINESDAFLGDTWEWDGSTWTLRSDTGPSPRSGHMMAYDSDRGVTVLFGGSYLSTRYNDTWEWNGNAWILRCPVCEPGPRAWHAMSYDSAKGVTVLFGGRNAGVLGDAWTWNGSGWVPLVTDSTPSAREDHAMTFDDHRRVTVMFGGNNGQGHINDTWELQTDSDGDGVSDSEDQCQETGDSETVVIGECETGVMNDLLDDGCSMLDLIAACEEEAGNHGQYVRCVGWLAIEWMNSGLITGAERGRIMRCVAGSRSKNDGKISRSTGSGLSIIE